MKHDKKPQIRAVAASAGNVGSEQLDDALAQFQAARTDPQGSYTGVPADPYETPVQDVNDL